MIGIDLRVRLEQAKDVQNGVVYALFHSSNYRQPLLSFGTVDTASGKLEVINKWSDWSLLYVLSSLCTFDPASAQFYAGTYIHPLRHHTTNRQLLFACVRVNSGWRRRWDLSPSDGVSQVRRGGERCPFPRPQIPERPLRLLIVAAHVTEAV